MTLEISRRAVEILNELRKHYKITSVAGTQDRDSFRVLIRTILSQRTKDANTRKASDRLFQVADTPEKIASLPVEEIEELIKPAGFPKEKAKRIKEVSKILLEKFGGKVPSEFNELVKLPGVGRKTANCVLNFAFGKPAICVDVHVHRISNRMGLVNTRTAEETEEELKRIVPQDMWILINALFVKHGQRVCLPRNPRCEDCPVKSLCERKI